MKCATLYENQFNKIYFMNLFISVYLVIEHKNLHISNNGRANAINGAVDQKYLFPYFWFCYKIIEQICDCFFKTLLNRKLFAYLFSHTKILKLI